MVGPEEEDRLWEKYEGLEDLEGDLAGDLGDLVGDLGLGDLVDGEREAENEGGRESRACFSLSLSFLKIWAS